jgi:hypothetical protein
VSLVLGCNAAMPCPSGQFCFNGLCALGCQSNANCAADQYCDTEFDRLCHNKVVPTCSTASNTCGSTQRCFNGFCSTPPPQTAMQCNPKGVGSGTDGCDRSSLCIEDDSPAKTPRCFTLPACAADKSCPVGLGGAVCNDGLVPNKAHICLLNACKTVANCPASWACFRFSANDVVGVCSNKGTGAPCSTAADCSSGNCSAVVPGLPGLCL